MFFALPRRIAARSRPARNAACAIYPNLFSQTFCATVPLIPVTRHQQRDIAYFPQRDGLPVGCLPTTRPTPRGASHAAENSLSEQRAGYNIACAVPQKNNPTSITNNNYILLFNLTLPDNQRKNFLPKKMTVRSKSFTPHGESRITNSWTRN